MTREELQQLKRTNETRQFALQAEIAERRAARERGDLLFTDWPSARDTPREPAASGMTNSERARMQAWLRQEQAGAMDEVTTERWNAWADARAKSYVAGVLDLVGEEIGELMGREDKKLDQKIGALNTEIGQLRAQITTLEAIMRGEVKALIGKDKKSDAAA